MTIASKGNFGTATSNSSTSSITLTTATVSIAVGDILLITVASDNINTTDGDKSEVISVTDSGGNYYYKLLEQTNGNGAAAAGATVSLWMSRATTAVSTGGSVTATFSSSVTAKCMTSGAYTVGAGNTLKVAGTTSRIDDASDFGTLSFSGLTSRSYLFLRSMGAETNTTNGISASSGWTATTGTQVGASADAGMCVRGERIITTATSATSSPTLFTTCDSASIMVALYEDTYVKKKRVMISL